MKSIATKKLAFVMALIALTLTACSHAAKLNDTTTAPLASGAVTSAAPSQSPNNAVSDSASPLKPYADVRGGIFTEETVLSPSEYKVEDMYT